MRCLVTGASGFLGSHLVRELLALKHEVVILLRPQAQTRRIEDCLGRVFIVRGSLENIQGLTEVLHHNPVEAAFHLAWSGVTAEHRNGTAQVMSNVVRSLDLWQVLQQTNCKIFAGVGSQAEYGPYSGALREDLPTAPVTVYGAAKLALGILLKQLCEQSGMRFVWFRLLSSYGPNDDERHMVPSLIRSLLRGEKPSLTAGEQVWDYLYVTDAVRALCASLDSETAGIFNLGSGTSCVLRDFISHIRDVINPALPLGFGEVPYRPDQVMNLTADITRLKQATGWSPQISMEEGIRRTVEWYAERGVFHAAEG